MRNDWLAVFTSSETYMPSERAYLCVVEDAINPTQLLFVDIQGLDEVKVWKGTFSFQDKVRQLVLKFGFGIDQWLFVFLLKNKKK